MQENTAETTPRGDYTQRRTPMERAYARRDILRDIYKETYRETYT